MLTSFLGAKIKQLSFQDKMTFPIKLLQQNLHKAAILESRHLYMTDSLTCPGLILKESLTVQLLQNGDSITWTLFPVSRERTFHLIHLLQQLCVRIGQKLFSFLSNQWPSLDPLSYIYKGLPICSPTRLAFLPVTSASKRDPGRLRNIFTYFLW